MTEQVYSPRAVEAVETGMANIVVKSSFSKAG